jgi:hypothetical protein
MYVRDAVCGSPKAWLFPAGWWLYPANSNPSADISASPISSRFFAELLNAEC